MKHTLAFSWACLLCLAVLSTGCSRCGASDLGGDVAEEVSSDPTPTPGATNGSQEGPEPLLAEMHVVAFSADRTYKKRILQDGSVWRFVDQRATIGAPSHEVEFTKVPRAWWFDGDRLAPSELRALTAAIRDLHLMDLPTDPPPPKETLIGATETRWTFALDGRIHEVRTFQGQPRPEVDRFDRLLQVVVSNAQQRWRRDRGLPSAPMDPLPAP